MEALIIIGAIAYIVLGIFLVPKITEIAWDAGEVLVALAAIWPAIFIGFLVKKMLDALGLKSKFLENFFIVLVTILVIVIIFLTYSQMAPCACL